MSKSNDELAAMLKQLTPRQLSQLMTRTTNYIDGSSIKAKQNARTEKYFHYAPKPHQHLTWDTYSDTVDYISEIGIDKWVDIHRPAHITEGLGWRHP
jgi:hypothetical protein|tara:strand:- start:40 stop:330 length:291 start_codon:yes stop_codon:yes gene_type:complete